MEEFVYYGILFDLYKELLSDSSKEYYSLYYEENLTLQEIADNKKVSKSYVGNIIKKTTEKLISYEKILGLYKRREALQNALKENDLDIIKSIIKKVI